MKDEDSISHEVEHQIREYILSFIKEKELMKSRGNLILSNKAFVVNAVLKRCFEKAKTKKMSASLWEKNRKILGQYIAGIIEIRWKGKQFIVIEVGEGNDNR